GDGLAGGRRQPHRRLHRGCDHPVTTDALAPAGRHLTDRLAVDAAHVDVTYRVRGADRLTVRDVSFQIGPRESFGLVGESGCGKTTMGPAIVPYLARDGPGREGSVRVAGQG